jgi:hypothetical protein
MEIRMFRWFLRRRKRDKKQGMTFYLKTGLAAASALLLVLGVVWGLAHVAGSLGAFGE